MLALFQITVLIMSVVIHEVAHGVVAYSLGDPTAKQAGRLTLNPISHLDPFGSFLLPVMLYVMTTGSFVFGWAKPVPYNPYNLRGGKWGPVCVALAGPATNLTLAIIFGVLVQIGGATFSSTFIGLASVVVVINVLLAFFNLLPIPPLDGSKLLFALFPRHAIFLEEFFARYQLFVLIFILFFGWRLIQFPVSLVSALLLGY